MSSLQDLRRESQEATSHKPSSWAKLVPPDAPKPILPSFKEILPAAHNEISPPEVIESSCGCTSPLLESYLLPFRRSDHEVVPMPFTMIKPENEAIHSTTRKTVHGKTLTYTLLVKQQPERARACGAGARGEFLACRCRWVPLS
jgi:hypothetical protein